MAGLGFFQGGFAEGAMGAQKQALAERTQTEDTALRSRGLDLQSRQLENTIGQQAQAQADKQIAETMAVVSETVKNATAVGRPRDQIMKAVAPLVQSAQAIAQRVGRDPAALAAQVQAQITTPGLVETASVAGRAAGVKTVEQERAIQQQPPETRIEISPWKTPKEKIENEDKLRDDFVKSSKEFVTIRDFYDRMKTATPNGAGDISLVFSFMKLLDPGSTVREGEYATASNAAGVPSAIQGMYNKLVSGGVLGGEARTQLKGEGAKIWSGALNRHSQSVTQYTNIAKRNKLDPRNVIVDFTAGSEGPIDIPPPPDGFKRVGR